MYVCMMGMGVAPAQLTNTPRACTGVSILPLLRGEPAVRRCIGHNFNDEDGIDKGFRCGAAHRPRAAPPPPTPPPALAFWMVYVLMRCMYVGYLVAVCSVTGKWKLVQYHKPPASTNHTDQSCWGAGCQGQRLLYDLSADLGERHDLSASQPEVLAQMIANASSWFRSVERSIGPAESDCPARVVPPGIVVPPT
jgi:hypothetical protein